MLLALMSTKQVSGDQSPATGRVPALTWSCGPTQGQESSWAEGLGRAGRQAAVALRWREDFKLPDWSGRDPADQVLSPPGARTRRKPLAFWWHPSWGIKAAACSQRLFAFRTAGWRDRPRSASQCNTRWQIKSSFFQEVASGHRPQATFRPSRLAVCLLHVVEEVAEELIPEEHEAGGEGSLQQAGGQALEEALHAFLPKHLPGAVQEAPVAANLGGGRLLRLRGQVITTRLWPYSFVHTNARHITAPNKYLLG